MLARVLNQCIEFRVGNVIADLYNEHRQFEPVYQKLGFIKVAEWARCEKELKAGAGSCAGDVLLND
jgi:hypothetical protein